MQLAISLESSIVLKEVIQFLFSAGVTEKGISIKNYVNTPNILHVVVSVCIKKYCSVWDCNDHDMIHVCIIC